MQVTPEYLEHAATLAKERPAYAAAVHEAHLGNLGLSGNAEKEIIRRRAPEIAHYLDKHEDVRSKIAQMPSAAQVEAIASLHEGPTGQAERTSNADTDNYIESRTRKGAGMGRFVGGSK
jgi:hypothetical protein